MHLRLTKERNHGSACVVGDKIYVVCGRHGRYTDDTIDVIPVDACAPQEAIAQACSIQSTKLKCFANFENQRFASIVCSASSGNNFG